jgi:hypothetical protein
MCAIESAALNNPTALVKVYTLNATLENNENDDDGGDEIMAAYENIQLMDRFDCDAEFQSSKFIVDWWHDRDNGKQAILSSKYRVAHLADLLRIWFLWKHGDFYSDLDTITIRSLKPLLKTPGVGYLNEHGPGIGSGILVFPAGSKLLRNALDEFILTYNNNEWGYNGPLLFQRIIAKFCNVSDIFQAAATLPQRCNVTIYPEGYFYQYTWYESEFLFAKNQRISLEKFIDAYSIHFYGKKSEMSSVQPRDSSVYDFFAKLNCPRVYAYLLSISSKNKTALFS